MRLRSVKAIVVAAVACAWLLPATCGALDSETLRRLIVEKHVASIERLLELLPLSLRSHYALVFNSRGLHGSSYRDPRVVLFGDDAKFIVGFNGHPGQRGYYSFETMEFDDRRAQFFFREFQFPDSSEPSVPVVVSEPNPEKCLRCHGHPARPIWDTHPVWPGAYGEVYNAPLGKAEQEGLASFLENQATHPRYRALKNLQVFTDRNTFHPGAHVRYDGTDQEPPNAVLSQRLGSLNVRALTHELAGSPRFPAYRYALLASLSRDCGRIEDYFPANIRTEFMQGFEEFSTRTALLNHEQEQRKLQRMQVAEDGAVRFPQGSVESFTVFRYLVEKGMGISTDAWTTALEKKTYDFTSLQPLSVELERQLRNVVAARDGSIQALASLREVASSQKYCQHLRTKSGEAIR